MTVIFVKVVEKCFNLENYRTYLNFFIQVYSFYGNRTNGEFFVHNAFVYPENENDAVEIKLGK